MLKFDNTYARELDGASVAWKPARAPRPQELFFNADLDAELGGGMASWVPEARAELFSGNRLPEGAEPIAQVYAGHQFGGFSPQLGDGRALLIGEVLDVRGLRRDIAFKGSGRTPFSRGGDGKAAVGPMLREVLIGESLHALGIPTTRALAVVSTGDVVQRERTLPGAVLTRVADSHLRVGTFEYFAARGDTARLKGLLDYVIWRHAPEAAQADDAALALLDHVAGRQAALIAQWMGVGFIHGVMNTDNMSISGQSIDFGPCAFMETHDAATVYSSIDRQGRYAYGQQPAIAQWNLARLAEALWPLMQGSEEMKLESAQRVLAGFAESFEREMDAVWCRKLGWGTGAGPAVGPGVSGPFTAEAAEMRRLARELALAWQALMQAHRVDHTLAWRGLQLAAQGQPESLAQRFGAGAPQALDWLGRWRGASQRWGVWMDPAVLQLANPFVVPRNHLVEAALQAATEGDLGPFESLLAAVRRPWDEDEALQAYGAPAPPDVAAAHRTFCGT